MTPRDVIIANVECAAPERIGFQFTGEDGWRRDVTDAAYEHDIEIRRWLEGSFEHYTDIWGNGWYRLQATVRTAHRPHSQIEPSSRLKPNVWWQHFAAA